MSGEDIKKKRKELGLTQEELARLIGVSKNTILNYEKGRVIPDSKISILDFVLSEKSQKDRLEAIQVDFTEMNVMHVPLVNKYAYAGYLSGFGDDEWIEELPKIPFANDVENRGEYMCFEVRGDSMDDGSYESYLEGDILLCRNIRQDFWRSKLHINKWDFVIVHRDQGILVKRIIDHDVERGILTLHSLNEYYQNFRVHLNEVAKLFNIVDFRRKRSRR